MAPEKVQPETLHQLFIDILSQSSDFRMISGLMPFRMCFKDRIFNVYIKNLSSAYFKDRPDSTRAQLAKREDFEAIKDSPEPFIFFGYDKENDVVVCWNYHLVKSRLNERKSVSFYSSAAFQEEVEPGEFLRKRLKNDDMPVLFKRKDLIQFFERIDTFFSLLNPELEFEHSTKQWDGKITSIEEEELLSELKPLLATDTPRTLDAIKVAQIFYGNNQYMSFKDWALLIKGVQFSEDVNILKSDDDKPNSNTINRGLKRLVVTFPDGTKIWNKKSIDTFKFVLSEIGIDRVATIKNLNILSKECPKLSKGQIPHKIGGWFLNCYSSTTVKAEQIRLISETLNLNLIVDII